MNGLLDRVTGLELGVPCVAFIIRPGLSHLLAHFLQLSSALLFSVSACWLASSKSYGWKCKRLASASCTVEIACNLMDFVSRTRC